jgi:GNAT superfamily N-acetyltransferase
MQNQTFIEDHTSVEEDVPGVYPQDLEASIATSSGRIFRLRPIRSDDDEKLVDFHSRLSDNTIHHRYLAPHPKLSVEEVHRLTQVDYVYRLALVIEDDGDIVAVGRYDLYHGSTTAETAFVVQDDYQHLGLGRHLLKALADAAAARGITDFRAETLSSNRGMLAIFRQTAYPLRIDTSPNETSVLSPVIHTELTKPKH